MNDRLLLAGTHSGCGKTTVTCALLGALHRRGLALQSYKCGPDYIDPMFHRRVLGVSAENLDPFFSTPAQLRLHLGQSAYQCSIIEGVMGYYDGIGPQGDASTYHVAHATDTPVVLVVNAKGAFTSLGATIQGFTQFRPESHIRGVIFNGCSPMLYPQLCRVAEAAGVQPYGFLPQTPEAAIGSRHLGLITADEISDLRRRLDVLSDLAEKYLDIDGLLALAATAS
ncbi:MAG: cobyrinic acid a,c-diamide synthase, partial [Oscillospiraceae bacterium]|nr:cobyrinic acid a,c-diamide synthase [Oscillospiraceae bacterium]